MRRIVTALAGTVTGLVLLFSYPTSLNRTTAVATVAATGEGTSAVEDSADGDAAADADSAGPAGTSATDGTDASELASATASYTGDAVQTRYGAVQVQITVTDGVIAAAEAVQYPDGDSHDQRINAYALPILASEALETQSADIDVVSGATVTSDAYITSLQSAIDQANLR